MLSSIPFKLVFTGNIVEAYLYKYANLAYLNYRNFAREHSYPLSSEYLKQRAEERKNKVVENEKRKDNLIRTRNHLRWRINANTDITKFWTLTYGKMENDITKVYNDYRLFRQRLIDFCGYDLKMIAVPEIQEDRQKKYGGVPWHLHMYNNADRIDKNIIEGIWSKGFVLPERIKHKENCGAYGCKYLTKQSLQKRLFGHQSYLVSKNLIQPDIRSCYNSKDMENGNIAFDKFSKYIVKSKSVKLDYSNIGFYDPNKDYIPESVQHITFYLSDSVAKIIA